MSRKVPKIIMVFVLSAASVSAETWTVTYDPNDPENRIGRVVEQAASGDVVLVEAGTYYEHIPLEGKSITLRSLSGPEDTILDGSIPFDGREDGIIYMVGGSPARLDVEGFSFRGGGGSMVSPSTRAGGAISWWTNGFSGAEFKASDCRFLWNSTGFQSSGSGGAVFVYFVDRTEISSCVFQGNHAWDGGGIFLFSHGEHVISNCDFVMADQYAAFGDAIFADGSQTLTIEDNCFIGSEKSGGQTLFIAAQTTRIRGNVFEECGGDQATRLEFLELGLFGRHYTLEFENNVLWNDSDSPSQEDWRIRIGWSNCTVDFTSNTLVNVPLLWESNTGTISCKNNIFYQSPVVLSTLRGGEICCNNSWGAEITTWPGGQYSRENNISEDPMFCDMPSGDFHIAYESPCAASNSPSDCGLIGARDPACRLTRIERVSWGRIKARFRE